MLWKCLKQTGDAPGPRSSHALAVVGNTVYCFGGELQPRVPVPADTYAYNLDNDGWSKLKTAGTCPGARVAATMAAVGTDIYLFGGRTGMWRLMFKRFSLFFTAKKHGVCISTHVSNTDAWMLMHPTSMFRTWAIQQLLPQCAEFSKQCMKLPSCFLGIETWSCCDAGQDTIHISMCPM